MSEEGKRWHGTWVHWKEGIGAISIGNSIYACLAETFDDYDPEQHDPEQHEEFLLRAHENGWRLRPVKLVFLDDFDEVKNEKT